MDRERRVIHDDPTIEMFHADSGKPGPTAFVVGGLHGNEVTSWEAARLIRLWSISEGELYVIPQANPRACEARTRQAPGEVDMNRQFPSGETPTHPIARAIWREITDVGADFVFDLHRSKGLYQRSPSGVGMAIFPTTNGRGIAERALPHMNSDHVPASMLPTHGFRLGNNQTGANPLLSHKVGADRTSAKGWLVETTTYEQDSYAQRDQLEHAVSSILWHATGGSMEVTDYGHHEHEPKPGVLDEYGMDRTAGTVTEKQAIVREVIGVLESEYGL